MNWKYQLQDLSEFKSIQSNDSRCYITTRENVPNASLETYILLFSWFTFNWLKLILTNYYLQDILLIDSYF